MGCFPCDTRLEAFPPYLGRAILWRGFFHLGDLFEIPLEKQYVEHQSRGDVRDLLMPVAVVMPAEIDATINF